MTVFRKVRAVAGWEEQRRQDMLDEEERRNRSQVMRQTRAKEAQVRLVNQSEHSI